MVITQQLADSPVAQAFHFAGFTWPAYTPMPDQLVDELLPILTGAELKVVLYICRRTLGFQKVSDNISLSQLLDGIVKKNGERLDAGTGLSKPTLLQALHGLQDKGVVARVRRSSPEHGDEATNYRLCFAEGVQPSSRQLRLPVPPPAPSEPVGWRQPDETNRGEKTLPGGWSKNFTPPVVKNSDPQETAVQETVNQETGFVINEQEHNNNSSGTLNPVVVAEIPNFSFSIADETSHNQNTETETGHVPMTTTPPPNADTPPSPTVERQPPAARALMALGMTVKVAERLAERYSLTRIEEKLAYLDFLQQYEPHKVKHPCGWLRTAIEQDYAAPDGYLSPAERAAQRAATLNWTEPLFESDLPDEDDAPVVAAQENRLVSQLQVQYGMTDEDRYLWQQTQQDLACLGRTQLCHLLTATHLLHCRAETALIGVPDADQLKRLANPQLRVVIGRELSRVAGRVLVPEFFLLTEEGA